MFLTVIISTSGSESLYYTLLSAKDQLRPLDELIIVSDSPNPAARKIYLNTMGLRGGGYYESESPLALGTRHAHGVWLVYLDDNSLLTPGALDAIRYAAQRQDLEIEPHPLLFKSRHPGGIIVSDVLVPFNQKLNSSGLLQESILRQGTPVVHDSIVRLYDAMRM